MNTSEYKHFKRKVNCDYKNTYLPKFMQYELEKKAINEEIQKERINTEKSLLSSFRSFSTNNNWGRARRSRLDGDGSSWREQK
jgi:hypothetical protein